MIRIDSNIFSNNIAFGKYKGDYFCSKDGGLTEYDCDPDDFCKDHKIKKGITIRPNFDSEYTIHNFITDFHMECDSDIKLSLFGYSLGIGTFFFQIFFTKMIDLRQRK